LTAEAKLPGQYVTAYQRVWLRSDVEDLKLEGGAAPVVEFRCRAESGEDRGAAAGLVTLLRVVPAGEARSEQIRCGGSVAAAPGTWRLQAAAAGDSYIESLAAQGRALEAELVELLPGERLELTAVISSRSGTVEGRLVDGENGPVAGAVVALRAMDPAMQGRPTARLAARTNAAGSFVIRGVPPGRYLAAAAGEGEGPEEVDWTNPRLPVVEVEAGQTAEITLRR
jgi:hypothetical protein